MNQAVNTAFKPDKDAKIGNRTNQPADFIAFAEMAREFLPRIRFALFHSQADPATLFVDFEHHHFHFLIELDSFAGRDIFICPIPCQGSSPSCLTPSETRRFSGSNFNTFALISCPTDSASLGCRIRRHAISVICSRPSIPPRSTNAP